MPFKDYIKNKYGFVDGSELESLKTTILNENNTLKQQISELNQVKSFKAAGIDNLLAGLITAELEINRDIKAQGQRLRSRAREAEQNNDYAKSFVINSIAEIVPPDGFGLQVKARTDDDKLDKDLNRKIERAWKDFSEEENFTVTGRLSRARVEALLVKHYVRDGEYLARHVPGNFNKYGYAVQVLNPDIIDSTYNDDLGNITVSMGIGFDEWGRFKVFYFKKRNKGIYSTNVLTYDHYPVSADQIIYDFDPDYANQARGVTHLAQSLVGLHHMGEYDLAAIIAARSGASDMGYFYKETPNSGITPADVFAGEKKDSDGNFVVQREPGTDKQLPPGWKYQNSQSQWPRGEHAPFVKRFLQGAGAGTGIPYPLLANDYEGFTWHSAQSAFIQMAMVFGHKKNVIAAFNKRVYKKWLLYAMTNNAIDITTEEYDRAMTIEVMGQKRKAFDQVKEAMGQKLKKDNLLIPPGKIAAENNIDLEEMLEEYKLYYDMLKELGLKMNDNATITVSDEDSDPDNEDDKDLKLTQNL